MKTPPYLEFFEAYRQGDLDACRKIIRLELNQIREQKDALRVAEASRQFAFNSYSHSRLRKVAKELRIKRYSVMSTQELIAAITKHPESQALIA